MALAVVPLTSPATMLAASSCPFAEEESEALREADACLGSGGIDRMSQGDAGLEARVVKRGD